MTDDRTAIIQRLVDEMTGVFPWVARIYVLLICLFGVVLIFSAVAVHHMSIPSDAVADSDLYKKLFTLAADGLKTVLGALIGSLSLAAEALWKMKSK